MRRRTGGREGGGHPSPSAGQWSGFVMYCVSEELKAGAAGRAQIKNKKNVFLIPRLRVRLAYFHLYKAGSPVSEDQIASFPSGFFSLSFLRRLCI